MQTNNIEDEANEFVEKFKRTFFTRYGVVPVIQYNMNMPYVGQISIQELSAIVDKVLNEQMYYDGSYATILTRTRKRPVVFYRHVFCYLALELRYQCIQISKYLDMNHSSVIHSKKLISNLLEVKDQEIEEIINNVKAALAEFVIKNKKHDTLLQETI